MKRTFYLAAWTWNTTTTQDFWRYYNFVIQELPDVSQYSAVFDEYRVNALKYTFRPRYDSVEGATAGSTGTPTAYAHYVVDPGSTLIPAGVYGSSTLNQVLENSGVKTRSLSRPFSVYFKPKVLYQTQGSSTAGAMKTPSFYRTTELTAAHRGFHMYIQQNNLSASAAANIILDVFVTVYVTWRNPR